MEKKMTIKEAAEYLGLRPDTIRKKCINKELPYWTFNTGKNDKYYFLASELDKLFVRVSTKEEQKEMI